METSSLGGHYFITGTIGGGKGLAAVYRIKLYLSKKRRIATNLDLFFEHILTPTTKSMSRCYRLPDHPDIKDYIAIGMGGRSASNKGFCLLDEVANSMNSRDWQDKTRKENNAFLRQIRKKRWDVGLIAQDKASTDLQLQKAITSHFVRCRDVGTIPIPVLSFFTRILTFGFWSIKFPSGHSCAVYHGDTENEKFRIKPNWRFSGKDIYPCYNTEQEFLPKPITKDGLFDVSFSLELMNYKEVENEETGSKEWGKKTRLYRKSESYLIECIEYNSIDELKGDEYRLPVYLSAQVGVSSYLPPSYFYRAPKRVKKSIKSFLIIFTFFLVVSVSLVGAYYFKSKLETVENTFLTQIDNIKVKQIKVVKKQVSKIDDLQNAINLIHLQIGESDNPPSVDVLKGSKVTAKNADFKKPVVVVDCNSDYLKNINIVSSIKTGNNNYIYGLSDGSMSNELLHDYKLVKTSISFLKVKNKKTKCMYMLRFSKPKIKQQTKERINEPKRELQNALADVPTKSLSDTSNPSYMPLTAKMPHSASENTKKLINTDIFTSTTTNINKQFAPPTVPTQSGRLVGD